MTLNQMSIMMEIDKRIRVDFPHKFDKEGYRNVQARSVGRFSYKEV